MTNSNSASVPPKVEERQEIRFAVVMYGGVSLAIYINGVAQELLKMVRSTAKNDNSDATLTYDQLQPTEKVYRKLSHLIGNPNLAEEHRHWAREKGKRADDPLENQTKNNIPLPTRFIVDIISGSSAGGINGIYLAKALSNDQQIDELKKLWINEGDISLLLNDKQSYEDLPIDSKDPPQSLLNSRRMYLKLLEALRNMDGEDANNQPEQDSKVKFSPNVDELDLFITTTDIRGTAVPLQLADTVVYERRYRNVFHFKYDREQLIDSRPRNEFHCEFNPFLAFAARCTSSFPFAFEPMALQDINEVLLSLPEHCGDKALKSDCDLWKPFFTKGLIDDKRVAYAERAFGDGGYLDNKPFSYATETLMHRYSNVPVDRKLLYIEPSPQHPEDDKGISRKPDAIENMKAAVLDLPGYETIREDLQRVLERNQIIHRVNRIIEGIERDVQKYAGLDKEDNGSSSPDVDRKNQPKSSKEWALLDLADMVRWKGPYYLPYRHLRIAALTDEMALLVIRLMGFDANSDEFLAIRCLVRAWREKNFGDYHGDAEKTVNAFLYSYDLKYRLRRLNYLKKKIDQLYFEEAQLQEVFQKSNQWLETLKIQSDSQETYIDLKDFVSRASIGDEAVMSDMRQVLLAIKGKLNDVFKQMRKRIRELQSRDEKKNELLKEILKIKITSRDLRALLGTTVKEGQTENAELDEESCYRRAREFLLNNPESYNTLCDAANRLEEELNKIFISERAICINLLNPDLSFAQEPNEIDLTSLLAKTVRGYLWHYYFNFDEYDQISLPIYYQTEVGESDIIDIFRISPEDAKSLVMERNSMNRPTGRNKLAGTSFHHFGAFLDRVWRQNDIMWGRLDGAERLITALLPNDKTQKESRNALIREAHEAILGEELLTPERSELCQLLTTALVRVSSGESLEEAVKKVVKQFDSQVVKSRLTNILLASLTAEGIIKVLRKGYEISRTLEPQPMLRVMARSTQVIGKMLKNISEKHGLKNSQIIWVERLGRIFWSIVELAAPNSLANMLFFHWLKLIYFFEAFLIAGGILLGREKITQFGILGFGITMAANFGVLILRDKMRGRKGWRNFFISLLIIVIILLTLVGGVSIWGLLYDDKIWSQLEKARTVVKGHPLWKWSPAIAVTLIFLLAVCGDIKRWWCDRWQGFKNLRRSKLLKRK